MWKGPAVRRGNATSLRLTFFICLIYSTCGLRKCGGRVTNRLFLLSLLLSAVAWAQDPPRDWIDPETGHRIVRLSDEPGSSSFYFHQNRYTAQGDKMVFSTRDGLSVLEFKTRKIKSLVP